MGMKNHTFLQLRSTTKTNKTKHVVIPKVELWLCMISFFDPNWKPYTFLTHKCISRSSNKQAFDIIHQTDYKVCSTWKHYSSQCNQIPSITHAFYRVIFLAWARMDHSSMAVSRNLIYIYQEWQVVPQQTEERYQKLSQSITIKDKYHNHISCQYSLKNVTIWEYFQWICFLFFICIVPMTSPKQNKSKKAIHSNYFDSEKSKCISASFLHFVLVRPRTAVTYYHRRCLEMLYQSWNSSTVYYHVYHILCSCNHQKPNQVKLSTSTLFNFNQSIKRLYHSQSAIKKIAYIQGIR